MLYTSIKGRFRGRTRPRPPYVSLSYICPYDNTYSLYIDLKCLLCVYVTVKIQFDNTSTYEYSSYSPYARSHVWAPLFRNSGSAPVYV